MQTWKTLTNAPLPQIGTSFGGTHYTKDSDRYKVANFARHQPVLRDGAPQHVARQFPSASEARRARPARRRGGERGAVNEASTDAGRSADTGAAAPPGRISPWVWALARLGIRIFYRVERIGGELPGGPLLLVANHPNTLADPALIQVTAGRTVRFLAKSTLFADHLVSPLIRRSGAIPVYRRMDPGVDTSRNVETFAAVRAALEAGEAVCLFPEGKSHAAGRLEPLRTGAARMVLASRRPVTIVAVGLNFSRLARFRSRVTAVFGRPFDGGDLREHRETEDAAAQDAATEDAAAKGDAANGTAAEGDAAKGDAADDAAAEGTAAKSAAADDAAPKDAAGEGGAAKDAAVERTAAKGAAADDAAAEAVRRLTGRIEERLRNLMVEAEPRRDLPLVERVDRLYAAARGVSRDPRERVGRRRLIARGIEELRARDPERLAEIAARVDDYDASLARFGLRDRDLDREVPLAAAVRFAAREGPLALVLGPLAILTLAVFAVPYWVTGQFARRAPDLQSRATWQLVAGAVSYPAWIGIVAATVGAGTGPLAGVTAVPGLAALALAGMAAVERQLSVLRTVRAFRALRRTPVQARAALHRQRAAIADVLDRAREWMDAPGAR